MPELPEVQTIVNDLNAANLVHRRITAAKVFWPRSILANSPQSFCRRLRGQEITAIWRRGKYLVFEFASGDSLLIHLRMSGRLHLLTTPALRTPHEHVVFDLDDGRQLRFHDPRKFGRLYLGSNPASILNRLGREPLASGFTATVLADCLSRRKRMLKPLLLDQGLIAGLGNIYVDEALWEASLHPCRIAASLSMPELKSLHRAIRRVLKRGLKNLGTSLGTAKTNFYSVAKHRGRNREQLTVFRRTGLPCLRCQSLIERIIVGQRSTHICPNCQKLKKSKK